MADLSPELASRIQSLESSYGDNPGRYFVALAGAWREGGDIARAEEILRENLKRFPGLSAHVLLGRCLADRGAFQEAANEFHYVLSIDSQNLIALRTLAEMAAAGGRRAEAERWYNELLAVDPMNVEARSALQQLARAPSAPAVPAGPAWGDVEPAAMEAGAPAAEDGEFGMIDLSAPDASPADASGVAADDDLGEWGDLTLDAPDEAPAPQPAADGGSFDAFGFGSVELNAEGVQTPSTSEWMDADARQDVGESAAADLGDLPLLDDALVDAPLAGAELPLLDLDATTDDAEAASAVNAPGAGFGFGEPGAGAFSVEHVAHEEDGHDREAEMVTETMAELYASQGLHAQAADVYRELIRQRGEEPGLVRRLGEIEALMHPAGPADLAPTPSFDAEPVSETPDWLESVDAFSRGGAEPTLDADVPGQDLSPAQTDETLAAESAGATASADDFPSFAPASAEMPSFEPAAAADLPSLEPVAEDLPSFETAAAEPPSLEPAAADDLPSFEPVASELAPPSEAAPELAASSASADPFADSFAGGFDGVAAEPAAAASPVSGDAGDERQAWEAPTVAETEPVGFDILVVADEDGEEMPAPSDVVADMSADWAIAAAPLEDDEEAAEAELAGTAGGGTGNRTMGGYFASLLAWTPAPADAPTYEVTADEGGTITFEAAAPEPPAAEPAPSDAPSSDASAEPPPFGAEAPAREPEAFPAAPPIPTFDAPSFQPPPPAFAAPEPEARADDEPWAAPAEDEPWAAAMPGESAPEAAAGPAPEDLPLLDLEEPWAESPAAPREPVDIGTFELAEDAAPAASAEPAYTEPAAAADEEAEELLPWEVPAAPAAAAPEPAAEAGAGGFSFEDFFAGAPAEPAPAATGEPEPEMPTPSAEPAFIPSFAEPTPPPVFEAPAQTPAPTPPPATPAASAQDEEDEDLESFQAWLQSLKR